MNTLYGYLQARVQARYAVLPDDRLWLHLAALKELASFLEEARGTLLGQWVVGLSDSSSAQEIEMHMQRCFLDTIQETASWFDDRWRPTVLWITTLIDLPTLDYLLRSRLSPESRISDPVLLELAEQKTQNRDLQQAWIQRWRSQWPDISRQNLQGVELLVETLEQHWKQFPLLPVQAAWKVRQDLEVRLRLFFRSHVLQPAAAFAYISLVALCLERLRAELLGRALFPEKEGLS